MLLNERVFKKMKTNIIGEFSHKESNHSLLTLQPKENRNMVMLKEKNTLSIEVKIVAGALIRRS